jgi:hypothetical protein
METNAEKLIRLDTELCEINMLRREFRESDGGTTILFFDDTTGETVSAAEYDRRMAARKAAPADGLGVKVYKNGRKIQ